MLRAAPPGTGIIAGGPMRAVFETLGVQDVVAKSIGSSNPYNMVRATFDALKHQDSPALGRGPARHEGLRRCRRAVSDADSRSGEPSKRDSAMAKHNKTVTVEQTGSPHPPASTTSARR